MTYVIAEPCIGTKDTACVDVCPVDCIHPRKDEGDFASAENDIGEAGQWHTHPSANATPSAPDLDTWADALRYTNDHRGSGLYVGLIATPGWCGSWHSPQMTAYVVRRGQSDYHGYVCEPAVVNVQGQRTPTWIAP